MINEKVLIFETAWKARKRREMISDASVFGKLNEPLFYDTKRFSFSAERNVLPWEQIEMILLILSLSVRF